MDFKVFEATPGISLVLSVDATYSCVAVSSDFLKTTGLSRNEVISKGFQEIILRTISQPSQVADQLQKSIAHVAKNNEAYSIPSLSFSLNPTSNEGKPSYFRVNNAPLAGDDGITKYIIHQLIDITHYINTNRGFDKFYVEDSEEKNHSLFNAFDQGFCILEMIFDNEKKALDYRFLETNNVFEQQTGLHQAQGKTARQLVPNLESYWFQTYGDVALTGKPIRFEQKSEAMKRWFEVYAFRMGGPGSNKVALLFTDITKRKETEEAVQRSEQNLRNTILQAPVAMCILRGTDFVVEVANHKMYALWGKEPGAMLQQPVFRAVPEARHQGLEEVLQQVIASGETFCATERPVQFSRSGIAETLYLNFTYEPLRDGDGKVSGVIAVAVDVTEQVTARREIEEHREELQMAIEIAELGTFTVDLQTQNAHFSQRVKEWFGTGELQESLSKVFALIHDEDRDRVVNTIQTSTVDENSSRHDISYRVKQEDGTERHLRSIGRTLYNADGKAYQIRGIIKDVTAEAENQKKMQESEASLQQRVKERTSELETQTNLLNSILQNSSNGISVTEMIRDAEGGVIDARTILANDAAINFTGLPKEVYLSKTAKELDPGIISSPYGQTCLRTLATGEPSIIQYNLEYTGRWLELTISKLDDEHLIHIFTDITRIKESQQQLEKTIEELRRSNANLEEFAYAASHDLKEPVRKIHFFSDRVKERLADKMTDEDLRYFERMQQASKRMSLLIDDLLNYSQVTQGATHQEEIDLNEKVKNVLEDLEIEVQQKNASVHVASLPTIEGNRRQMQQLFQNLIGNALKYSKPGIAPEISISSRTIKGKDLDLALPAEDANKTFHLLEVADNGVGFEQKDAARIFNMFTRLHGNAEFRGTGVGLSIVRKVVENHQGFIWAESEPGQGAKFKVLLPAD